MNILARKLYQYGGKIIKDNPDMSNPLNIDGVEFAITIGKGILKVGKEILF
jgi:hypothetical protein